MLAMDKKRGKEEKDLQNRLKVFARLQSAGDHESFALGFLCERCYLTLIHLGLWSKSLKG